MINKKSMSEEIFIPVILGSSRDGRKSKDVAELIIKRLSNLENIKTELVDVKDFDIKYDGNDEELRHPKYSDITQKADAFIFVIPEYNHGYPGKLKSLFDTEWKNYNNKPALLAGVSAGNWGGTRVIEQFQQVLKAAKVFVINADIQFRNIAEVFDENGNLLDESYNKRIDSSLDYLIWTTKTLKYGRDNIEM